jgi:hypothetical protein
MPRDGNIMDSILTSGGGGEGEASSISILFDTKNYQRLKMTSEIQPDMIFGTTVLGTIQRRFRSKVLKLYDEEFLTRQKSKDRKGILELIEVLLAQRRSEMGGED